jgi:hypothetical protein
LSFQTNLSVPSHELQTLPRAHTSRTNRIPSANFGVSSRTFDFPPEGDGFPTRADFRHKPQAPQPPHLGAKHKRHAQSAPGWAH